MVAIFIVIGDMHSNVFNNVYLLHFKERAIFKIIFPKLIDLILWER